MTKFSAIDLTRLPFPDVVQTPDFEVILSELKTSLLELVPDLGDVIALESEPVVKMLEVFAYREVLLRGRINDSAKAVALPHATGADLENLVAFFGLVRLEVTPADPSTSPPTAAVLETDDALRKRAQLALEGFSTAGTEGSYIFHALSADARVIDVSATSPTPGEAVISLLTSEAGGAASQEVIDAVESTLIELRPLTTLLTVRSATIQSYQIIAELTFDEGPSTSVVLASAQAAIEALVATPGRIGRVVSRSAILAALHQPGVGNVDLTSPAADIVIDDLSASACDQITLTEAAA